MAVAAADVLSPNGLIEKSLFPDETINGDETVLLARVTRYITEGAAKPGSTDKSTTYWAYHKAFEAVYIRLSGIPSSTSIADEGSHHYTQDQLDNFLALSKDYKKLHDAEIGDTVAADSFRPRSGSIPARFRY